MPSDREPGQQAGGGRERLRLGVERRPHRPDEQDRDRDRPGERREGDRAGGARRVERRVVGEGRDRGSARRARAGRRAAAPRAGSAPARRPRTGSGGRASRCGARAARCRPRSAAARAAARPRAARASSRGRGCRRAGCTRRAPASIGSSAVVEGEDQLEHRRPGGDEGLRRDRLGAVGVGGRHRALAVGADPERLDARRGAGRPARRGRPGRPAGRARPRSRRAGRARSNFVGGDRRGRSGRAGPTGCRGPSRSRSRTAAFGSGTPGCEIAKAASTFVRAAAARRSARSTPSAPSPPPSVEAKISVWLRRERPRSSARPSSVAVADALVVAPVPSAVSRAATTRIVRSDVPGSVRITFSSLTSSPSKLESKVWVETSPPSIPEKRSWTRSATAWSPAEPGVRSGASATIERAVRAASDAVEGRRRDRRRQRIRDRLEREHQHRDRGDGGQQGCAIDPRVEHLWGGETNLSAWRGLGSHPARRRRGVDSDASGVSAPQGGVRSRGRARRSRGRSISSPQGASISSSST